MRHTKLALLIFGVGLVLGFTAVVGPVAELERAAAAAMALGLVLLPLALFADGHGMRLLAWIAARLWRRRSRRNPLRPSRKPPPRRRPLSHRRPAGATRRRRG